MESTYGIAVEKALVIDQSLAYSKKEGNRKG
jgi:hypothetical protein